MADSPTRGNGLFLRERWNARTRERENVKALECWDVRVFGYSDVSFSFLLVFGFLLALLRKEVLPNGCGVVGRGGNAVICG